MKYKVYTLIVVLFFMFGCAPSVHDYIAKDYVPAEIKKIALLPLENVSGEKDASDKVTNIFFVELMRMNISFVCEPGEVKNVLAEERIRSTGEIDKKTLEALGKKLNINLVLIGSLLEYNSVRKGDVDIPQVGISVRMLEVETGRILWSANHFRRGNDTEIVFGLGRETSISRVAQRVIVDILEEWKKKLEKK